jgi:hypothetical protein
MVTRERFHDLASSLPDVELAPHFEKQSFRVKKKIFATLSADARMACVKLQPADQALYSSHDPSIIFAVPNKWGKQGWTNVDLRGINVSLLKAILQSAYETVSKSKTTRKPT